jgi:hypothetical protein
VRDAIVPLPRREDEWLSEVLFIQRSFTTRPCSLRDAFAIVDEFVKSTITGKAASGDDDGDNYGVVTVQAVWTNSAPASACIDEGLPRIEGQPPPAA